MHDDPRDDIVWRAHTPGQWLHDLRNGVNTAGVSLVLGRRLLARGDSGSALDMFARAEESLAQCRELLASGDDVLGISSVAARPPAAGGQDAAGPQL
jgi:hypothetical protein